MTDIRWWVIDWSGDELSHRYDPDSPHRSLCGHDWSEIFWQGDFQPDNYAICHSCTVAVGERRRQAASGRTAQRRRRPAVSPARLIPVAARPTREEGWLSRALKPPRPLPQQAHGPADSRYYDINYHVGGE